MNIKIRATDGTLINADDELFKFKRDDEMSVTTIYNGEIKYISLDGNELSVTKDETVYKFTLLDKDLLDIKKYISMIVGIELPDEELAPRKYYTSTSNTKNKSKLVLTSMILTSLYVIYSIYYWSGVLLLDSIPPGGTLWGGGHDAINGAGGVIALAIIAPHLILVIVAFVFNIFGYFMDSKGFILTSAILYAVAMLAMPLYAFFILIQMIIMFVAVGTYNKRHSL